MNATDFAAPEPERELVAPVFHDTLVTVYQADCLDLLSTMPADSVASVITDPPYGLEFMGRDWDAPWKHGFAPAGYKDGHARLPRPRFGSSRNPMCLRCHRHQRGRSGCQCVQPRFDERAAGSNASYQAWCTEWAVQCLRVLKPGGHLVAFGGSRTWHRLASALEDAGFEIRDTIAWLHGQGFPKSLNVSAAIDRAAGADRVAISRGRPGKLMNSGAEAARTQPWRQDDAPVIIPIETIPATAEAARWHGWGTALKPAFEPIILARKPLAGTVAENVLRHGVGGLNIRGCRVETVRRPLRIGHAEDTRGKSTDGSNGPGGGSHAVRFADEGRWPPDVVLSHSEGCKPVGLRGPTEVQGAWACAPSCPVAELDRQSGVLTSGANPVRRSSDMFRDVFGEFAGKRECVPARGMDRGGASRFFPVFRYQPKAPSRERPRVDGRGHPTVKPVALMRWLVRLVTPPGGLVLDPFLGSGTTAEAARAEGFRCIGVEREAAYVPLIRTRLGARPGPGDSARGTGASSGGTEAASARRAVSCGAGNRDPP